MNSKVTIIMATYNRSHFILETLYSIQNQSYEKFECLIIDDGGTDNTLEVITPILENDLRFKFFKRPDHYQKGLPGSRNYGIDLAVGDYILFFDDDDIVHPDNLKIGIEVIETNNTDFCHYQKKSFQDQKPIIKKSPITILKSISKDDIANIITHKIGLASCTVIWKKKCFENIRFNESLAYAEEWECYSKIISENFKGTMIGNILYFNRKHPQSNTGEFFQNNPIRRESQANAVILVVQNLKEKKILTNALIKHLISFSLNFKEYNLYNRVMNILDFGVLEKLKWSFFYRSYFLRMPVYKIKKRFK